MGLALSAIFYGHDAVHGFFFTQDWILDWQGSLSLGLYC